jgi:hypothetical protein
VRRRIRARLARHENIFTLLWYLHLVRNEDPRGPVPPAGWLAQWRRRRELARDITSTAGLVLAVAAFFTLIAAVCVAVFVLN